MTLTSQQRISRLRTRAQELQYWAVREYRDLCEWNFEGVALRAGSAWPHRDGVVSIDHAHIEVPAEWPMADVRLDLDVGGEALVCLQYDDGTSERFGHDPFHHRYPVTQRGFSLSVEAVARSPFGAPNRDARLGRSRLLLTEPGVVRLARQLYLLVESATVLGEHDVVIPLIEAGERAMNSLVWPSATADYLARVAESPDMQSQWELPPDLEAHPPPLLEAELESVRHAGEQLEHDVRRLRSEYPPSGSVGLTGHAHIDLIWLWPLDETVRKAQRTFNTMLGLLERYPEMRFNQSSAQLYALVEEADPELFARIRTAVENGQWEPVGGMWVEPDINMPSGESLVRQLLYGQRYFKSRFGAPHTVCWLPDCFGFSPALPQLLRAAGIERFFTIKVTWSETNTFPYDLFWWEGLDGSRVLAHTFNNPGHETLQTSGYNGDPGPHSLLATWKNYRGKHRSGETLLSIGYGDGGGGVTPEMLEEARELQAFPALPRTRFTYVSEFFERAEQAIEGTEIPVWLGEIYLELHRGTLTTQGRTKYLHRRAERDLVAAEVVSSIHHMLGGPAPSAMGAEWQLVLRNEFHDVLPGSSIHEVYERANDELAGVVQRARERIDRELAGIASHVATPGDLPGLLIVNPDLTARPIRLQLQHDAAGAQKVAGGYVVTHEGFLPGLGCTVRTNPVVTESMGVSVQHLENNFVRVHIASNGTLSSVWDKRAGRESLDGPGNALYAYVDKPRSWDAWDIDTGYEMSGEFIDNVASIAVTEDGPHRVTVRIVRTFRQSTICQDLSLWANSARVDIKTQIEWHDRRWLLKARFPLAVRASQATYETAFGVIERPTHRNTTWDSARFEVVAHRFVDVSEPGFGVALLNDGKYGHDIRGNVLGLSLLRSPVYPDALADEGEHSFTYALLPHAGPWYEGDVLMEAEDLNRPLLAYPVRVGGVVHEQPLALTGLTLGLGTLKGTEEGDGLIFRVYEPCGGRGTALLDLPEEWSTVANVNLLEESLGDTTYDFTPFAVRSWRLQKGS
ncbi:MAG: alpha-mannosidase [Chloroflexota bacterium]